MKTEVILSINPGSTSTKFAFWSRGKCLIEKSIDHSGDNLDQIVFNQLDYRCELIEKELDSLSEEVSIVAISGRGGPLKPLEGGTYTVNTAMLNDLRSARYANHASNLGAMLADIFARRYDVPAYVVDPVTVDEFISEARFSGVPWCERKSRLHALNIKAVVNRAVLQLEREITETNFVVAHLGGGTSIAAVKGGRIIDVNDALHGMGPFSPERAGALPIGPLVERCFNSGKEKKQILMELARNSGLKGYLGTANVKSVLEMIDSGDSKAEMTLNAMIYQNTKEIGAMVAALGTPPDAIILTGGLVKSDVIVNKLKKRIKFIASVLVFPGEGELRALAEGAFRVIDEIEKPKTYI